MGIYPLGPAKYAANFDVHCWWAGLFLQILSTTFMQLCYKFVCACASVDAVNWMGKVYIQNCPRKIKLDELIVLYSAKFCMFAIERKKGMRDTQREREILRLNPAKYAKILI